MVSPATVWIGYGIQYHVNGGANVRAIDAFVAMTDNIGIEGGGARYGHLHTWGSNYNVMLQELPIDLIGMPGAAGTTSKFGSTGEVAQYSDRSLNISQTAKGILEANELPIRMLWVTCKNPFAQSFDRSKVEKAFEKLGTVACADQSFNETAQRADIVLPVATTFEKWNVNTSCWHYWLPVNQPATKPMYRAKHDLEAAVLLSRTISKPEPGSYIFPQEFDHERRLDQEFNDGMAKMFGISSWDDLLEGPKKAILPSSAAWHDRKSKAPSERSEFKSKLCGKSGHTALPEYKPEAKGTLPFHLFTPHVQFGVHSQFINPDWMQVLCPEPFVYMHPAFTGKRGIVKNNLVRVFSAAGEVELCAKVTINVPEDFLVIYEARFPKWKYNVQNAVADTPVDMGLMKTGAPGAAIHSRSMDIILIDKGAAA